MLILRPTLKLKTFLPANPDAPARSDTALGDWYVNRLVVDRRPLLLLVSSTSLLPILIPARNVAGLPGRLVELVSERLRRLRVDEEAIDREVALMAPITIGRTVDRSVVGTMIDFANMIPYHLTIGDWEDDTLFEVEDKLADSPCRCSRPFKDVIWPRERAPELLRAR